MYRSAKDNERDYPCPDGPECWWPPENCAFVHDEAPGFDPQNSTNFQYDKERRRKDVEALIEAQGWKAEMRFFCTRKDCDAGFFTDFDRLLEHKRNDCPRKPKEGGRVSKTAVALAEARAAEAQDAEADKAEAQAQAREAQVAGAAGSGADEEDEGGTQAVETEAMNESNSARDVTSAPGPMKNYPNYSEGPSAAKREAMSKPSWR